MIRRVPNVLIATVVLIGCLAGCSSLQPLSATRTLNGYPAKDMIVIVPEPYSFKPVSVTHTLPAGAYTPVLEDANGVYFQSPSKLLLDGVFGPTLHDGGIFFKGGISSDVYEYIILRGQHSNWKLPPDFKFRIKTNR